MIRPTVARVDLHAIRSNLLAIRACAGEQAAPPPGIIAVVKANAYGHGGTQVAQALEAAGAAMLACADIEEGMALRDAGIGIPILVFGALSVSDLDGVFTHRLTPTISTPSAARALEAAAASRGVRLRCHLKIDTGMNRLGFRHDNLRRTLPEVAASRHLEIEAVYTHFATADDPEHPAFAEQRERFDAALAVLPDLGIPVTTRHAANSAAILRDERVWYDAVRPGLLLYGIVPPPLASTLGLRPALSLHSRIVAVKGLRPGEAAGYGLKVAGRASRRRSRSCRPGMPTVSTSAWRAAGTCSSAGAGCRSSARSAWTSRCSTSPAWTSLRATRWSSSASRMARRSRCGKSPRRSARFRTSCSAAWVHGSHAYTREIVKWKMANGKWQRGW